MCLLWVSPCKAMQITWKCRPKTFLDPTCDILDTICNFGPSQTSFFYENVGCSLLWCVFPWFLHAKPCRIIWKCRPKIYLNPKCHLLIQFATLVLTKPPFSMKMMVVHCFGVSFLGFSLQSHAESHGNSD